jgi:hypothetical protein
MLRAHTGVRSVQRSSTPRKQELQQLYSQKRAVDLLKRPPCAFKHQLEQLRTALYIYYNRDSVARGWREGTWLLKMLKIAEHTLQNPYTFPMFV